MKSVLTAPRGHRIPKIVLHELRTVVAGATDLLGGAPEMPDDFLAAQGILDDLAQRAGDLAQPGASIDLFMAVIQAREQLRQAQLDLRVNVHAQVQEALGRLNEASSVARLAEQVPETVCRLGFDRAVFSEIQESVWIPQSCHVEGDPHWATEILATGRAEAQVLDHTVVETEAVRRRRVLLVTDAQNGPRGLTCLLNCARTNSYVVAPVLADNGVLGLLHADRYMQHRQVDEFDREVLGIFALGLGIAFRRTMLVERLQSLRSEVGQFTMTIANAMDEILNTGGQLPPVAHDVGLEPSRSCVDSALTRRQLEVLRLMGDGKTNAGIATRLTISEGTAKSHVKQILRKLGAANRAEAVSLFMRMQAKEHA